MNIVIPMAGRGQRFADAGWVAPKPLIDVAGRPMIARVIDNLPDGHLILCHRRDQTRWLRGMLHYEMHDHGTTSIPVDEPTEGPACTVLLAAELIDSDEPLLIANCDQLVEGEWAMLGDGVILVFDEPDRDPRWSYVHVGADGWVDLVAEKDPISTLATCGIYGFRRGRDFVAAARAMIAADERVGGEFYVAPVYNRLIADGAKIAAHRVDSMIDMGTPEALERSLDAVR